jgi:hypothetical protein
MFFLNISESLLANLDLARAAADGHIIRVKMSFNLTLGKIDMSHSIGSLDRLGKFVVESEALHPLHPGVKDPHVAGPSVEYGPELLRRVSNIDVCNV